MLFNGRLILHMSTQKRKIKQKHNRRRGSVDFKFFFYRVCHWMCKKNFFEWVPLWNQPPHLILILFVPFSFLSAFSIQYVKWEQATHDPWLTLNFIPLCWFESDKNWIWMIAFRKEKGKMKIEIYIFHNLDYVFVLEQNFAE